MRGAPHGSSGYSGSSGRYRNKAKQAYAVALRTYLDGKGKRPERPKTLSTMAAQAVEMTVFDCYPESVLVARGMLSPELVCNSCGTRPVLLDLLKDDSKPGDQCPCCFLDDYDCDGTLEINCP